MKRLILISLLFSNISALSPLDGRYAKRLTQLRQIMSEQGYMHKRVQVEVCWLIALSDAGLAGLLSSEEKILLTDLVKNFSEKDFVEIKEFEKKTNHDVKAVEYWIKSRFDSPKNEFVHFACTSEDINNTSYGLQLKDAREEIILPALDKLISKLCQMAHEYAEVPMISRTHGQVATPTTVGKEIANFVSRLVRSRDKITKIKIMAKMNGAVGNYNAHLAAFPDFDWELFSRKVIESLGLNFQVYTTQIEPHDYIAELFDAIARTNTILIGLSRDLWGYISLGYFKQKVLDGEVGSSTMPHKVNPIDFENAEGNLGLSNALLRHMSEKLPISRWQRDLTDSTVIRNMGVAIGHAILAYDSVSRGLEKLKINQEAISSDLDSAWEVLAEPIQTVMRRFGIKGGYEQLKNITRGKSVTQGDIQSLILSLEIPISEKERLLAMTPSNYIGKASELANRL